MSHPNPLQNPLPNPLGWRFNNSYLTLAEEFYTRIHPMPVARPELVVLNHALAAELGLTLGSENHEYLTQIAAGNLIPVGAEPIAQAYAGDQFGHFALLGDGRAHLLGEHLNAQVDAQDARVDIQLKGSGRTPYSRNGDGRAALAPMLREYLISEAMHALGIPTTRSLAVVRTGETVLRETPLAGAVLMRVAKSHLRVGTIQLASILDDPQRLKSLADYAIARHDPELKSTPQPYLGWLEQVMKRQIELITHWMRVGFIHGVMNTDNMALSGETLDYGPCAFMDAYDPSTVFSFIDRGGRYAYGNQPHIAGWNLARFAGALLPLLDENSQRATAMAQEVLSNYGDLYQKAWLATMGRKIGLEHAEEKDRPLIENLLGWMQQKKLDFTNTFRSLTDANWADAQAQHDSHFANWQHDWRERLTQQGQGNERCYERMQSTNPAVIPRNHRVEEALQSAQNGDMQPFHTLLDALHHPYTMPTNRSLTNPPTSEQRVHHTFCGT